MVADALAVLQQRAGCDTVAWTGRELSVCLTALRDLDDAGGPLYAQPPQALAF